VLNRDQQLLELHAVWNQSSTLAVAAGLQAWLIVVAAIRTTLSPATGDPPLRIARRPVDASLVVFRGREPTHAAL